MEHSFSSEKVFCSGPGSRKVNKPLVKLYIYIYIFFNPIRVDQTYLQVRITLPLVKSLFMICFYIFLGCQGPPGKTGERGMIMCST